MTPRDDERGKGREGCECRERKGETETDKKLVMEGEEKGGEVYKGEWVDQ